MCSPTWTKCIMTLTHLKILSLKECLIITFYVNRWTCGSSVSPRLDSILNSNKCCTISWHFNNTGMIMVTYNTLTKLMIHWILSLTVCTWSLVLMNTTVLWTVCLKMQMQKVRLGLKLIKTHIYLYLTQPEQVNLTTVEVNRQTTNSIIILTNNN